MAEKTHSWIRFDVDIKRAVPTQAVDTSSVEAALEVAHHLSSIALRPDSRSFPVS